MSYGSEWRLRNSAPYADSIHGTYTSVGLALHTHKPEEQRLELGLSMPRIRGGALQRNILLVTRLPHPNGMIYMR